MFARTLLVLLLDYLLFKSINLMNQRSIAIIGAGISGLSLAVQLQRTKLFNIKIYEKQQIVGGRVYSQQISPNIFADMGANIIDFQNEKQQTKVRSFLSHVLKDSHQQRLKLLKKAFLIYQDSLLKKGDYEKQRYCYVGGFKQLLNDLESNIQPCEIIKVCEIEQIKMTQEKKWKIKAKSGQISQIYDYIVLSCCGPTISRLLHSAQQQQLTKLSKQIGEIEYTRQISAAFQFTSDTQFSSVLFKKHSFAFISSHSEKYPQQKAIIVIQMAQKFSQEYFTQNTANIEQSIRKISPQFVVLGKCLGIKKWDPSLIRIKKSQPYELFQRLHLGLAVIGDISYGSSRISGAIQSSIDVYDSLMALQYK